MTDPEHDRTSCSDAHLDRGAEAERLLRIAQAALHAVSVLYPRRTILAEVTQCRAALAQINPFLES